MKTRLFEFVEDKAITTIAYVDCDIIFGIEGIFSLTVKELNLTAIVSIVQAVHSTFCLLALNGLKAKFALRGWGEATLEI